MQNNSKDILRELVSFFKINLLRARVYEKLLSMTANHDLNSHFQAQLNDSNRMVKELELIFNEAIEDSEKKVLFEDLQLSQPQFYFGMAQNSDNIPTIVISCKFGDEYLKGKYQKAMQFFDFRYFPKLKNIMSKYISNIHHMMQVLETTFSDNKLLPS